MAFTNVAMSLELNFDLLRGLDDAAGNIIKCDKLVLADGDTIQDVFTDDPVGPSEHFLRNWFGV